MHCGAEVTESSTNKQHHLSFTARRGDADGGPLEGGEGGGGMGEDLEGTYEEVMTYSEVMAQIQV
jgi:hypothetical protein